MSECNRGHRNALTRDEIVSCMNEKLFVSKPPAQLQFSELNVYKSGARANIMGATHRLIIFSKLAGDHMAYLPQVAFWGYEAINLIHVL